MKKIFIAIPTLLILSGCTGLVKNTTTFKYECAKLEKPYIDESLRKKFNESKEALIEYDASVPCLINPACQKIKRSLRWDKLTTNLKGEKGYFPEKEGFYTIYKDYNLKNCAKNISMFREIYENNNGKFCVAAEENNDKNFLIKYKVKSKNLYSSENIYIDKQEYKIFVDNKLFLSTNTVSFSSPSTNEACGVDDEYYRIIIDNF